MKTVTAWGCGILLLSSVTAALGASARSLSSWEHGVGAHDRVLESARRSGEPVIVYFNTDWCGWCRRLNTDYLPSYQVRAVLDRLQKVEINPENGSAEDRLFDRYNGRGFPTFLVAIPSSGQRPVKITPFRKNGQLSQADFADLLRSTIAGQYDREAHELHKRGDHDRALAMLEQAVQYDPGDAYAHFLQGRIYHQLATERRDAALLYKAKSFYQRALELDPDHRGSRQGLETLKNL